VSRAQFYRSWLERTVHIREVTGSSPVLPTLRAGTQLKNLLGHADMGTVLIYVRLAAADLEVAQQRASVADRWKL